MAIAYDAATQSTPGTGNLSWTHTPVGTPRGVLVLVAQLGSAVDRVSGVTYGGVAMTRVDTALLDSGEDVRAYAYFLGSSIPTGNQTVVVTVTDVGTKVATAITATAAADTEVEDTGIWQSTAGDPLITLVTGAGVECFVTGVLASGENSPLVISPGADYTELFETDHGAFSSSFTRRTNNSTGGNVTVDWATDPDEDVAIGVAITEVAGGVTITPDATALTLTATAPVLSLSRTLNPSTTVLLLSASLPSIQGSKALTPDPSLLSFTATTAAIDSDRTLTPDTTGLSLTLTDPTLASNRNLTPDPSVLVLSPSQPTVLVGGQLSPDPVVLVINATDPTVQGQRTLTPDATQIVFTATSGLAAPTEGWYFRAQAGVACGPGSRFTLSLTPDSSPVSSSLIILVGADTATWNRAESVARSLYAGVWKIWAVVQANASGRSCQMVVERRNASCVVQETILDVTKPLAVGTFKYEFEQASVPIVHFSAGDILTIRANSSHSDTTVRLHYNRLNVVDDAVLVHPAEIPPTTITPDSTQVLFTATGVTIVVSGVFPKRNRLDAIINSPRLAVESTVNILAVQNRPRLTIDVEG